MNSLVGYGSDEDSDSGDERKSGGPIRSSYGKSEHRSESRNYRKPTPHEDNYDEVGMDMSEDSDSGNEKMEDAFPTEREERGTFRPSSPENRRPRMSREDSASSRGSREDRSDKHDRNDRRLDRGDRRDERNYSRKDQEEETWTSRSERKKEARPNRDEEWRNRDDRNERGDRNDREKDRNDRDRDTRRDRDDKDTRRDRDDKDTRRDRDDRDRRDDRKDGRRDDRDRGDRRDRERDRRRSRSRSRDRRRSRSPKRSPPPRRGPPFSKRDKAAARMDRLDKLGIELNSNNSPQDFSGGFTDGKAVPGSLLPPGVTGKFREQIEKRKLLWQKAKEEDGKPAAAAAAASSKPQTMSVVSGSSKATKVYEATTFADDKQSCKFKRLMGIKDNTAPVAIKNTDVLKKQEEMFSSMEAQYEVARTATHTMRGVGLGFGSFQR